MIANKIPIPAAAIKLSVTADTTTPIITKKSNTVDLCFSKATVLKSTIRIATTIRIPAKDEIGIQATSLPNNNNTNKAVIPKNTPDLLVVPPLFTFTSVAPICTAPGIPQASAVLRLAIL